VSRLGLWSKNTIGLPNDGLSSGRLPHRERFVLLEVDKVERFTPPGHQDIRRTLPRGPHPESLAEVSSGYGLRLSMSGKWDTECGLVSKAASNNAGPQGYYEVGMALCAFMRDDLQAVEL